MEALSLDLGLGVAEVLQSGEDGGGEGADPSERARAVDRAMHKAGALLSSRARTEHELEERLLAAGFGSRVVAQVVGRLKALGLVDDSAFAQAWVEERSRRKGLAARALIDELIAKGVDAETAERAVADVGLDEDALARVVAARLLPRVARLPFRAQAARLQAGLARRGFSDEAIEAGVRAALPPEGWD